MDAVASHDWLLLALFIVGAGCALGVLIARHTARDAAPPERERRRRPRRLLPARR